MRGHNRCCHIMLLQFFLFLRIIFTHKRVNERDDIQVLLQCTSRVLLSHFCMPFAERIIWDLSWGGITFYFIFISYLTCKNLNNQD